MHHEILGEIVIDNVDSVTGTAKITHNSREIDVQVNPDDQNFETTLNLAAETISRLDQLDIIAKYVATNKLRDVYNNGWNEYDEVQEDGSLKLVTNPKLTASDFEKNLSLIGVNVTGRDVITFFYDDGGMFWGHCITVTSLNALDFTDAYADLFG